MAEWRRDLLRSDKHIEKAFKLTHKKVSERIAAEARPKVAALPGPGGSLAAAGIKAGATAKHPRVILAGSNPTVRANVFGTLSHTVFGRRVSGRGPWLPWVGRSWTPDELYGVGPVFKQVAASYAPSEYADALIVGLKQAFPD